MNKVDDDSFLAYICQYNAILVQSGRRINALGACVFVALSKFVVANGMTDKVKLAFQNRPHLVDDAEEFIRMEVLCPQDNVDEFWLVTYWQGEDSYKKWHKSHMYHESHAGIPKGLKLVPKETEIRFFEWICS